MTPSGTQTLAGRDCFPTDMALADSTRAIGATTRLLVDHLIRRTGLNITATHPRAASGADTNPKLNLFLYETAYDPHLKNVSLQEGAPAPLWLVAKYLLTAYDDSGASDTANAHDLIGSGLAGLQEVNFLRLDGSVVTPVRRALENNPEALKVTFEDASADLISKLLQGPDETYRFSVAFQVRPLMIVPEELPSYDLLVGIDYETSPPVTIGLDGVQIGVLASMGPLLESVQPESFSASVDDAAAPVIEIRGQDLHLAGLECVLGPAPLPVVAQTSDRLSARVGSTVAAGTLISAGEHPLALRQPLPGGRFRPSNLLTARLRPTLATVAPTVAVEPLPVPHVTGNLVLTGNLLGRDVDDVRVALYQAGSVVEMIDVTAPAGDQTTLTVPLAPERRIPPGGYRIILVVNGQQATNSPTVSLS